MSKKSKMSETDILAEVYGKIQAALDKYSVPNNIIQKEIAPERRETIQKIIYYTGLTLNDMNIQRVYNYVQQLHRMECMVENDDPGG